MIHTASAALLLAAQSPGAESISWGAMGAWGSSWDRTEIASDGSVIQRSYDRDRPGFERCEPPDGAARRCVIVEAGAVRITRYSIGSSGYREIRAILDPVRRHARARRCPMPTDIGNAWITITASGGSISLSLGEACSDKLNSAVAALSKAAVDKLAALSENAPKSHEDIDP